MRIAELVETGSLQKELNDLIEAAHVLASDDRYILPGSGSVSAKLDAIDSFGRQSKLVFVSQAEEKLGAIQASGFSAYYHQRLVDLVASGSLDEKALGYEVLASQVPPARAGASASALLHAAVPFPIVFLVQPAALMAVASVDGGRERLQALSGGSLPVLPYQTSGPALAQQLLDAFEAPGGLKAARAVFVLQQGLVAFGASPADVLQTVQELETLAQRYLEEHKAWSVPVSSAASPTPVSRQRIAALRKELSDAAKAPLLLKTSVTAESVGLVQLGQSTDLFPVVPAHLPGYKYAPLRGGDVASYAIKSAGETCLDAAPRIILDPELGLCSAGFTAEQAAANAEYFSSLARVWQRSMQLGTPLPLSLESFEREKRIDALVSSAAAAQPRPVFDGEVALVTGAASGIGKACAQSFLERGAAVVGLDISPGIVGQFPGHAFLGVVCDVSDEEAVRAAVDQTALAYGGLDMLVLNAGIFPAGCRIDAMSMAEWEKVISINLSGNMALMRETFALLKLAPRHGRVVINGSRNVRAPGPGASAYSASKAALTQLARVAALEWGKDGIRVNVVHPNAVFDTALYTEDVLKARAASYGITVDQYKKNNILQVEITSRDVGEMVAEMCGPLFAKITGAQISIDGGSDRVI